MKFLVFQHLAVEHPGILRQFWAEDGITWDVVELDEGESIPSSLDGYDALVAMGGPQDTWQTEEYPWLVDEIAAIRRWVVDMERPFMGICLGHQLLANALDGEVSAMAAPEVGLASVRRYPVADADPLFGQEPVEFSCFQWHGAEVKTLPRDAAVLAGNDLSRIQAFRWGHHAYGLQYHVEITSSTVADWACVPEYKASLESVMGSGAIPRLEAEVAAQLPAFAAAARRLNDQFTALVAKGSQYVA
jgi:GMP synthase-like glutamine amidotransferase